MFSAQARQWRGAAAASKARARSARLMPSSRVAGVRRPIFSPYFAGQGGDGYLGRALRSRAGTVGIDTSIIVPGAFNKDTNHFAHAGVPADKGRLAEYEAGPI